MNRFKVALLLAAWAGLCSLPAHAEQFEFQTGCALGGGPFGSDTHRVGLFCTSRLRLLPEVPIALEVSAYLPYGAGAGLVLDIYRGHGVRVHFLDLGAFVTFDPFLRAMHPEVPRAWDLTVGAGIEWFDRRNGIVFTLDWRAFLPDPTTVPYFYGGFSEKFYFDALKGGQLWLGFAKRF